MQHKMIIFQQIIQDCYMLSHMPFVQLFRKKFVKTIYRPLIYQAPVPIRLFSNVMTLHWYKVNVNKMSTLLKLRPTNAGYIVLTCSLDNRCIQTFHWTRPFPHTLLRSVHCDVIGRSRHVSTSMFFSVPY